MSVDETVDPAAGFAALMSSAEEQSVKAEGEAPYGYTKDRRTGELRPKKAAGRGGRSGETALTPPPSLDELKQEKKETPQDRPPGKGGKPKKDDEPIPQYRPMVIAKGMTLLYQRTGKIIRAWDHDIGQAVIESAEDCGAAWDELAKANPRIRRSLMKLMKGSAYSQLIWAHAPIAMAIIMKDGIRSRLPLGRLFDSMSEPDSGTAPGEQASPMTGGLTPEDMQQAMFLAQQQMDQMFTRGSQPGPRAPQQSAEPVSDLGFLQEQMNRPAGNPGE